MTIRDVLLDILGLKKTVDFLTLQYVKISIKTHVFAIDIYHSKNTFITFFKLIKLIINYRNTKAPSQIFGKILNSSL